MSRKKRGIKLKSLNKKKQGFTLIELIVAISIMGVLLIVALPQVQKIQAANKDRKYQAYEKSMVASSKLYIDSYAKDLFGNNNSGCVRIKYSELKNKNLIKDFSSKDISCANDNETYIEVRKVLDEYKYKINMVCKDTKKNKQVYKAQEITGPEGSCSLDPDLEAPKITVTPANTNSKWYNSKNLAVKIKVSDVSGLNSNIAVKYDWYNQTTGKTTVNSSHSFKNKKGVEQVSYTIPTSKMPSDAGGIYKLTVTPDASKGNGVQDALGNKTLTETEAKEYWIDNQAPTLSGSVTSTDSRFQSKSVKVNLTASDNFTPTSSLKVYISNTGYQTGGSWRNYSTSMDWTLSGSYDGGRRTVYVTIKDLAGNTTSRSFPYTIYKNCTVQLDNGNWYDTSSCNRKCGGGKKEQTKKKKDAYTNASCPSITQKVDCNLQGCCSRVNYKDGKTCSASCGSGTKNQEAYSYYDGSRCIANDLPSGGSRCNTGIDCCSKTNESGNWRDITGCNASCGTGTKRQEINLVSAYNGISCGTTTRNTTCDTGISCCVDTEKPKVSSVTLNVTSATAATVSYNASDSGCSGMAKYVIQLAGKSQTITNINTKSVTFSGINTQNNYQATVTAYDNAGNVGSRNSDSKCIAGSYRIPKKSYSVGAQVRYLCDNWTVIKNNSDNAVLVRNTPMNKSDVELAGINTSSNAIVDGCNSTACMISHCAWSSKNPDSSYCWIKGNRATGVYNHGSSVAYSWPKSYIKKVIETYMNNNYLLKQAKNGSNLVNMSFSDGIGNRTGYIRIPTMGETAASNALTWINKSNPSRRWSWTLTKHDNKGDGATSINRNYWTILGYANTVGSIYPVIQVKKA